MRIAFCYPPFSKGKKFPNLPQNRQFIYTASKEVKIYPVVMATAATWMKNLGNEVLWLDGITRRMDWKIFEKDLFEFDPELIVLESKAPIMNQTWKFIDKLKTKDEKLKVVLVGDHATFFPEESLKNSKVDYILTGGDYDFLLKNLVQNLEGKEKLEPGIWYKKKISNIKYEIANTEKFRLNHILDQTPVIDRNLTRWRDYGEAYLYRPCAYVMFGRGCGISQNSVGVCTFCIWQQALWHYSSRLMTPKRAIEEVKNLVNLGVKEIFDDSESGVLKDPNWLEEFYRLLKKEKLLGKIIFSSNARGDQLNIQICKLLKKTGYRLLKVGLESGSNEILDKISKKEKIEQIIQGVKNAKDTGLRVMLTVMVGYPSETEDDAERTYKIVKNLVFYKTRAGDCLQASVITPYPGTVLWKEATSKKFLKVKPFNYEKFDMSMSILKSSINSKKWCKKIWAIQKKPKFILKQAITIRSFNDLSMLSRGAKSLLGHFRDYAKAN